MERNKEIDFIKGIAILGIVIEHCYEATIQKIPVGSILPIFSEFIIIIQLVLFFACSGYLYAYRERGIIVEGRTREYIKKKALDQLLVYCFFALFIWMGKVVFSSQVKYPVGGKDILLFFVKPISYAWFLYVLFIIEVIVVLIDNKIKNKHIVLVLGIILSFIANLDIIEIDLIKKVLYYFVFYYIGISIYDEDPKLNVRIEKNILCVVFLFICLFVLDVVFIKNTKELRFFAQLVVTPLVFVLVKRFKKFAQNASLIMFLGKISIYIYLVHPIVRSGVRMLLVNAGLMNPYLWICTMSVTSVVVSIVVMRITKKVWWIDFLFSPRKYLLEKGKK